MHELSLLCASVSSYGSHCMLSYALAVNESNLSPNLCLHVCLVQSYTTKI